jgi:hypothetical protein
VLLGGEGLQPSAKGKRVTFAGGDKIVSDGPFAATEELVAGFWLGEVASMEEALAWAKRCPDPMPGERAVLEIRPVFESAGFGDELTQEAREREERLRARIEEKRKS